ncbi:leucyl/phenylalanyl-tRNA--protein transferase [Roseibium algae]|uniref:Leucyl/phenylalanyl-tRNA--protein transferase n=1 Tax=Roseibium algae TaxID=3123038 RepID=A0ABU8TJM2_9HYPH
MTEHNDNIVMEITPQVLLKAYACGLFPMAESADDPSLFWLEPEQRGILPLDKFHIPKRLKRTIRADVFEIRVSTDFNAVISGCAASVGERQQTWINAEIRRLYGELFEMGHCQTVEAWQDDKLVGGLYGVNLNGVFFGESMFTRTTDASKVCLAHLVARMISGGYALLDTQFVTEHLTRFGAIEVSRKEYSGILSSALKLKGDFHALSSSTDFHALSSSTTGTDILDVLDAHCTASAAG